MTHKWLEPDEGISLEGKAFVWVKTPFNYTGNWARLYLTNKRLYIKERLLGTAMLNAPYSSIKSASSDGKHLRVDCIINGREYCAKIRMKNIEPIWEWSIKQRVDSVRK
jgi:hypothetical protein